MTKKTQREVFLSMTIIGSFLTLFLLLFGAIWAVQAAPQVFAELGAGNRTGLAERVTKIFPISLGGGPVFCSTLASYWRYHRLAFTK